MLIQAWFYLNKEVVKNLPCIRGNKNSQGKTASHVFDLAVLVTAYASF
ncbi:hypothetical protein CU039_0773 [Enterococcus faecium]|nr:hypothetical protein [Enterococcus faecium]MBK4808664.1 hypothetical protein [Enterococcus faecium]